MPSRWGEWADWLGVPRHTFSAVFGAVVARGEDYREAFRIVRPGLDLDAERERRRAAGQPERLDAGDLYPDVRPCLAALREQGVLVGVAGNQPASTEALLREAGLPVDVLGTSDGWGAQKPGTAFFERLIAEAGTAAWRILYVGDRLDNDVRAAAELGINTAVIRRGPWGHLLRGAAAREVLGFDVERRCLFLLDDLAGLPDAVRRHRASAV